MGNGVELLLMGSMGTNGSDIQIAIYVCSFQGMC